MFHANLPHSRLSQSRGAYPRRALLPWFRDYHRGSRGEFLATQLDWAVESGCLLDIGAGKMAGALHQRYGDRYSAIDIGGSYNGFDSKAPFLIEHDVNSGPLPFEARSFDTVLCMDVLEHVDDPHMLFREAQRVARKRVVISLPNNWVGLLQSFLRGRNVSHRTGYGLPLRPPAVGQRHKWFFNAEEGLDFLLENAPHLHPVDIRMVFTPGTDSFVFSLPGIGPILRDAMVARRTTFNRRFGRAGFAAFLAARLAGHAAYAIDALFSVPFYALRRRQALYNLRCRQVWVVLEHI